MTIVFVQSARGKCNTGTTVSTSVMATTTGNSLIFGTSIYTSGITFSSLTDNDGGAAPKRELLGSNGNGEQRTFTKHGITGTASYQATLVLSGDGYGGLIVSEFSGLATSGATDQKTLAASYAVQTGELQQPVELAVAIGTDIEAVDKLNVSAGWTIINNTESADVAANVIMAYKTVTSAGAVSASFSSGNTLYNSSIMTFRANTPGAAYIAGTISQHAALSVGALQIERTTPYSVRCTFNCSVGAVTQVIYSNVKEDAVFAGHEIWINPSNQVGVRLINTVTTNWVSVAGTTDVSDDVPRCLWVTYDGTSSAGSVAIYLNGVAESISTEASTLTGSIVSSNQQLYIASQAARDASYYLRGSIASLIMDVGIARSAGYVSANSSLSVLPAVDPTYTKLYLAFTEGTGTMAYDQSGQGNDASLTSVVMWRGTPAASSSTAATSKRRPLIGVGY